MSTQKRLDTPFLLILDFSLMSLWFPAVHHVNSIETKNTFPCALASSSRLGEAERTQQTRLMMMGSLRPFDKLRTGLTHPTEK